jgi:hypothetical protein
MPFKDKAKHNEYMKMRMRLKKSEQIWKANMKKVCNELLQKAMLPRHIYEYRMVLKDMLRTYFDKRIIKKHAKTELITGSYKTLDEWLVKTQG